MLSLRRSQSYTDSLVALLVQLWRSIKDLICLELPTFSCWVSVALALGNRKWTRAGHWKSFSPSPPYKPELVTFALHKILQPKPSQRLGEWKKYFGVEYAKPFDSTDCLSKLRSPLQKASLPYLHLEAVQKQLKAKAKTFRGSNNWHFAASKMQCLYDLWLNLRVINHLYGTFYSHRSLWSSLTHSSRPSS